MCVELIRDWLYMCATSTQDDGIIELDGYPKVDDDVQVIGEGSAPRYPKSKR